MPPTQIKIRLNDFVLGYFKNLNENEQPCFVYANLYKLVNVPNSGVTREKTKLYVEVFQLHKAMTDKKSTVNMYYDETVERYIQKLIKRWAAFEGDFEYPGPLDASLESDILHYRILKENLSLRELSIKHNVSYETIRQKELWLKANLKQSLGIV